jgi:hypothetical protein
METLSARPPLRYGVPLLGGWQFQRFAGAGILTKEFHKPYAVERDEDATSRE